MERFLFAGKARRLLVTDTIQAMLKAACLWCALLAVFTGSLPANVTREAWVALAPELAGLHPGLHEAEVRALLRRAGTQIDATFQDFTSISMAEEVTELRFDADDMAWSSRKSVSDYSIEMSLRENARPGYMELLQSFVTDGQNKFQFSPFGHIAAGGHEYEIVAFTPISEKSASGSEGLLWLDTRDGAIHRILVELPGTPASTMDVIYHSVRFDRAQKAVWLPGSAVMSTHQARLESLNVHRFSTYEQSGGGKGSVVDAQERLPNAVELLGQASEATDEQAKEALLQRAAKQDPERPETHFQIAIALWRKKAFADAERELRTALQFAPDAFVIHNLLAIVLFGRNNLTGAIAEFRASLALNSANATSHFNLAEALEKSGDAASALEEYRKAAELDPNSKHFGERLEARTHPVTQTMADTPIRVDVRQVVVPVVITRDGHRVSGLSRNDFHVFEDGVEQNISAFTVEKGGLVESIPDAPNASTAAPGQRQARETAFAERINRTYVVCVDALHTTFSNLVYVRKALVKLFGEEHEGDSQYAVVTVGSQMTNVHALTRSPAATLAAVEGKEFERAFLGSRKSSTETQTADFRREASRVRSACDHVTDPLYRAICDAGKLHLQSQADQLAEFERLGTVEFLRQLRFLVEKMSAFGGRRSIVLVSDGFNMVPGQVGYLLLQRLFPDMRGNSLRGEERIAGELEPVLRMSQQKNVVIYTIDSRGLYTMPMYNAEESGGSARALEAMGSVLNSVAQSAGNTLQQIASDTGGTSFRNNNDILKGLEQAFADGRDYYTLAYTPTNTSPGKQFHKITIKTNDNKVRINAKSGYWTE